MTQNREQNAVIVTATVITILSLALAGSAFAQSQPQATFTQWDLFTATGGNSAATQNVASILRDANGTAGPAGAVWTATQRPEPRLGRLDPETNTYLEWRPLAGRPDVLAGAPLGLTHNPANGDLWMATQGVPSLMLKTGFSNTFRRFDTEKALVPQGLAVAPDGGLYAALPLLNAYGQGRAIIYVPRNLTSTSITATVWRFDTAPAGEPRYVAVDAAGNVWYTDRLNNVVGRLTPSTDATTEWTLPAGSSPIGLHFSADAVCVASDGIAANTGAVQCLNPATNQITIFESSPTLRLDRPQQLARNSYGELFVTEWRGNAVVFIGQGAYASASTAIVQPVTRTRSRTTIAMTAQTITVEPQQFTVAPSVQTLDGAAIASGQIRYTLPTPLLQYPFPMPGPPQPFGITAAFNDFELGSGVAYLAEYYSGPHGQYAAGVISKLEVIAPRAIRVSAAQLDFAAAAGSHATLTQQVAVTEANGLSLDWTATTTAAWLTLSPASGAAPGTLSVTVHPAQLTEGVHEAVIVVDDGPTKADPKEIRVVVTAAPQAVLAVSSTSLTFNAKATLAPVAQQITVSNAGGGGLDWQAAASEPWIHVQDGSGAAPAIVTVALDAMAAPGTYTGVITFTADGALNAPQTVAITYIVASAPPKMTLSPGALSFTAVVGGAAPAAQTVTLSNTGGEPLEWVMVAKPDWVSVTPASATVPAGGSVTLTVSAAVPAQTGVTSGYVVFATNAPGHPSLPVSIDVQNPDTTPPVISVPPAMQVAATGANGAQVTFTASAVDGVDGPVAVTCSPASGATFPLGSTTVTCTAGDAAGNSASASFTIAVEDRTAPSVTVPANLTREATGAAGAAVTFAATAADSIDGTLPVSCSPDAGATFPLGATTVTCSATDAAGNQGSGSFTVTVRDTTAPVLSLPAGIVRQAASAAGVAVTFSATANDAVGGSRPVSCSPASGSVFPVGTTTVTCTASDAAGNTASGSFTIQVTNPPPSFVTSASALIFQTGRLAVCNGVPVGPNWKSQGLQITNTGTSPLTYSIGTGTAWLRAEPSAGTIAGGGTVTVTVSVDLTGLSHGTWNGSMAISAAGGASQTVPVALTIGNAPATLCLTPSFISYGKIKAGKSLSKTFDILNVGDDPLGSWSITKSATHGTVTTNVSSGSGPRRITVTVKAGTKKTAQSGTVTVTAPGAVLGTQTTNLSWTVY